MRIQIGRVAVYVSYPFAAMLALILLLDTKDMAVVGLLAAFFHEIGHLLWMTLRRTGMEQISFTLSGIHIRTKANAVSSYRYEAALALAGPLFNLLMALLLFLMPQTDFFERLQLANLAMMGVNVLPIQALDGGSALEALLCMKLSRETAEKITFCVSLICLIPLIIFGFIFVLNSKYNFSLLILALFLLYNIAAYSKKCGILGKGVAM